MRSLVFLLACSAFAQQDREAGLKERHDREDQRWASVGHLPKEEVRAIRMAAGISDVTEGVIGQLDTTSLRARAHILVVENWGGCIRVHVVAHAGSGFKEIWLMSGLRDRGWEMEVISEGKGRGICSQAPRGPSAHATPDGRIVVEIPNLMDPFQRSQTVTTYTFVWDGLGYAAEWAG